MIFVTVGTDGPFDRLIRAVDRWTADTGRRDVFAQIGRTGLQPAHIEHVEFLEPPEFQRRFDSASLVVSHAGMGTILTALRHGKRLIVMPRLASLGEQRNEHQLATARRLHASGRVTVAFDEAELRQKLEDADTCMPRQGIGSSAQPQLLAAIRDFIHAGSAERPDREEMEVVA